MPDSHPFYPPRPSRVLLAGAALLAPLSAGVAADTLPSGIPTVTVTDIATLLGASPHATRFDLAAWHFLDAGGVAGPSGSPAGSPAAPPANDDGALRYGAARACGVPALSALAYAAAPATHRHARHPDDALIQCSRRVERIVALYRRLFPLNASEAHFRRVLRRIARDGAAATWNRDRRSEQALIAAIDGAVGALTQETIAILALHHANTVLPRRLWPIERRPPVADDGSIASAAGTCDATLDIYVYPASRQRLRRAKVLICDSHGHWAQCDLTAPLTIVGNHDNTHPLLTRLGLVIDAWSRRYADLGDRRAHYPPPIGTVIDAARSSLALLGQDMETRVARADTVTLLVMRAEVAMAILEGSIVRDERGDRYALIEHLVLNPANVVPQPGTDLVVGASDFALRMFIQRVRARGVSGIVMVALTALEHRAARDVPFRRWDPGPSGC
ncbi:hypothetical protein FOB72_10855 [Cupriavidus pauculus]|jgi:hypothetical protein|uniref:Uncharacterized protein n=1 Tax=Cupriavidus pauculus TaxID=82633 RepID=A0A5P2H441_9BURK|nr:hypothetical protein [Cupriavidus pauculus]QET02488.1 hypothetical protein FOB72_10855 [Cupriavidus pauculus]